MGAPRAAPSSHRGVGQDDELSEAHSWSVHSESERVRQPVAQPTHTQPLHQRAGRFNINETQIQRILQGQELTQPTRSAPSGRGIRPIFHQHHIPISSAPARSSRPIRSVFGVTPPSGPTSMNRVREAVGMIAAHRDARRGWNAGMNLFPSAPVEESAHTTVVPTSANEEEELRTLSPSP